MRDQHHARKKTRATHRLKQRVNFLAVYRYQDRIYYKQLEPGQFILLSALQTGATLEKACAKLAGFEIPGDLAATIQGWFSNWAGSAV